jgi:ABC-type multidrug transport system permease subunit
MCFWKEIVYLPFPRDPISYQTLVGEQFFHKCPRHWTMRAFNSVCSQGSQLQQIFPEVILEPREERNTFYKGNIVFLFLFLFFLFLSLSFSFSFSLSLSFSFSIHFSFSSPSSLSLFLFLFLFLSCLSFSFSLVYLSMSLLFIVLFLFLFMVIFLIVTPLIKLETQKATQSSCSTHSLQVLQAPPVLQVHRQNIVLICLN